MLKIPNQLNILILSLMMLSFAQGVMAIDSSILPQSQSQSDTEIKKTHIKVNYKESLDIELASRGINRINVWPLRVEKIICDLSHFSINVPDNGTDLFLTSKVNAGSKVNATIILSNNESIDLHIKILESDEPKYIELDFKNLNEDADALIKSEARSMINTMIYHVMISHSMMSRSMVPHVKQSNSVKNNEVGKYYIKSAKSPKLIFDDTDYSIKQTESYQYGKLYGAVLEIKNKKRHQIVMNHKTIISNFKNVKAFAFASSHIGPKKSIKGYVVFKSGDGEDL